MEITHTHTVCVCVCEVCVTNSRQCSHSTDTVSSSQQPTVVPVEKNHQSSQSTATTDMTDMSTLQVDGIVGLPTSDKVHTLHYIY